MNLDGKSGLLNITVIIWYLT